eukprot:15359912-Ditylum_brightwellii.AAC.1
MVVGEDVVGAACARVDVGKLVAGHVGTGQHSNCVWSSLFMEHVYVLGRMARRDELLDGGLLGWVVV